MSEGDLTAIDQAVAWKVVSIEHSEFVEFGTRKAVPHSEIHKTRSEAEERQKQFKACGLEANVIPVFVSRPKLKAALARLQIGAFGELPIVRDPTKPPKVRKIRSS
jgi:hypothetical protein